MTLQQCIRAALAIGAAAAAFSGMPAQAAGTAALSPLRKLDVDHFANACPDTGEQLTTRRPLPCAQR